MVYSVLLAGGLSSRMGTDKARLIIDNETLLDRAHKLLKQSGSERILISGAFEGYHSVPDLVSKCGPLGGIYSCLAQIKRDYGLDNSPLLIVPVDMPKLTAETLEKLIEAVSEQQCCHYDSEVFPCVMRASEALYDYLTEMFAGENEALDITKKVKPGEKRSMKGLMEYLAATIIEPTGLPEDVFININRPQDLRKLLL